MWVGDRHFLKYAGARPAKDIFKEDLAKSAAAHKGDVYEKPLDSPDRPSNITKAIRQGVITFDSDNPSTILAAMGKFNPPVPEGQEPGVVKDSPDNPSAILAAIGTFKAPQPDQPPPVQDAPAPQAAPPAPPPEAQGGQIVRETA